MIRIRESFGAKVLTALLGTVGLLLTVTFLVVRVQTGREVEEVTERTIRNASALFAELDELQRQQTAQLTDALMLHEKRALEEKAAIEAQELAAKEAEKAKEEAARTEPVDTAPPAAAPTYEPVPIESTSTLGSSHVW